MRKLIFLSALLLLQCARQSSPTGGPKDEQPPQLVISIPTANALNYNGKEIVLVFDEYVQLNNPKEEIIANPPLGKQTTYIVNRNKVTITPENPWQENTTYNLIFREGIRDITERNPVDNLHLAFSTGPEIDSLTISGEVEDRFSGKKLADITVAIYATDTFNI